MGKNSIDNFKYTTCCFCCFRNLLQSYYNTLSNNTFRDYWTCRWLYRDNICSLFSKKTQTK